jgi:hypothetical protein
VFLLFTNLYRHFASLAPGTDGPDFRSKAPPIEWLAKWAPDLRSIPNIFERILEGKLVAARKSCLLGQGSSQTDGVPSKCQPSVSVETLEVRFVPCSLVPHWPLDFGRLRFIIEKMTIHGAQVTTQYELCSARKADLSRLRTFNCRVYVEPPRPRRPVKSSPRSTHVPAFFLAIRRPRRIFCCSISILTASSPLNTLSTMRHERRCRSSTERSPGTIYPAK